MAVDQRKAKLAKLAEAGVKKYGDKSAIVGYSNWRAKYYSTGSPTLDYMLGTGGVPDNAFTEVFGPPSIGKTTMFGAGILRSVHAVGGVTATIATEPDFDEEWMEEHGVDPELNIVYRPDTGEEAFAILRDLIWGKDVDYVLWDSLAAASSEKEQGSDKPQAFGNAAMNSWGIKNVATKAWKNRVGVCFINQIRDVANSRIAGQVKSTGGHAVHHFMKIRIQVKPGKDKYTVKVPSAAGGTEELMVGRQIRAVIVKNKAAQELGKQAVFDFYHIETDDYPFGFDTVDDALNIAKVSGVVQGSGWLMHEAFPGGKIQGTDRAKQYLREDPKALEKIQADVREVMVKNEREAAARARAKKEKFAS